MKCKKCGSVMQRYSPDGGKTWIYKCPKCGSERE